MHPAGIVTLSEINLPAELAKLKDKGWIRSIRKGDTGRPLKSC